MAQIHSPARNTPPLWPPGTVPGINLVDIVIAIAVLLGALHGYRRGLWLSVAQYAGLVIGVVMGAALAPAGIRKLSVPPGSAAALAAILIMLAGGSLGYTFGSLIGGPLRKRLIRAGRPGSAELALGALFSALMMLLTAWFLGVSFSRGPNPGVARLVQSSSVIGTMTSVLPPPPGVLTGVQQTISAAPFPTAFSVAEPGVAKLELPANADTPAVRTAARSVWRVEGHGCGGIVTGSSYPVARGYLITNAHVVAGTSGTTLVQGSSGLTVSASVVLVDTSRDVAILRAPAVSAAGLETGSAQPGTQGAVVGYPGGGAEDVEPAVVNQQQTADGRDIYGQGAVRRNILILQSLVRPGNSGGPLVDLNGRVLGLVFAASSSHPGQAYALTNEEVADDVRLGTSRASRVDASVYDCAV
ncbi:MAG: MarP family serine protease [Candidatus Dormibacteraeota bacterium]|nr:MarP family serine protease [Candidatus Dormibacteraeota bacterium]